MAISKVWIEEGCTACGLCEDTCPEVFELGDEITTLKEGVDFNEYEELIQQAADECPVEVIQYE